MSKATAGNVSVGDPIPAYQHKLWVIGQEIGVAVALYNERQG